MRASNRPRTALLSLLTTLITLGICYFLIELVVGNFLKGDAQLRVNKVYDAQLGWLYQQGSYEVKSRQSFFTHTIHINDHGLRQISPATTPSSDSKKLVFLGDSFTFAKVIADQHHFISLLSQELPGHDVFNAGVEGFGTGQSLSLLRRLLQKSVRGDVYVLQLFTNDILDNLGYYYYREQLNPARPRYELRNGEPVLAANPVAPEPDAPTGRGTNQGRSESFNVIRTLVEPYAQTHPTLLKWLTAAGFKVALTRTPGLITGWYRPRIREQGIPLMKAQLKEIRDEVERQGAKLVVMFIPSPMMVYPEAYIPLLKTSLNGTPGIDEFIADPLLSYREILRICRELDIELVDMYRAFSSRNQQNYYFPREGHLNRSGHEMVAQHLAPRLRTLMETP